MLNIEENELFTKYQPDKYHPFYYALNQKKPANWFIFGSLTWEKESRRLDTPRAQKYREYDFNCLINIFCKNFKLRPKNLTFYRTTEFGKGGDAHFHFLMEKSCLVHLMPELCAKALQTLWTSELRPFDSKCKGIGTAVIEPYNKSKEETGVKYCLKRQFTEFGQHRERYDFLSKPLINLMKTKDSLQVENYMN